MAEKQVHFTSFFFFFLTINTIYYERQQPVYIKFYKFKWACVC